MKHNCQLENKFVHENSIKLCISGQKNYPFKKIVFIPYGAEIKLRKPGRVLRKFGLKPKKYIHFVGRLTPENCVEDLILAFKKIKTDYKCVIVGDSVYEDSYKKYLVNLAKNDKRIVFTGFLHDKDYKEVCSNSYLYVETKEVGGIHPSILEAMAFGNCILAKNIEENINIIGKRGLYYVKNNIETLINKIKYALRHRTTINQLGLKLKLEVQQKYRWELIVKHYENTFRLSYAGSTKNRH